MLPTMLKQDLTALSGGQCDGRETTASSTCFDTHWRHCREHDKECLVRWFALRSVDVESNRIGQSIITWGRLLMSNRVHDWPSSARDLDREPPLTLLHVYGRNHPTTTTTSFTTTTIPTPDLRISDDELCLLDALRV